MSKTQQWDTTANRYLIVCCGDPGALSVETTDAELVYTRDIPMALSFATKELAEGSPWHCLCDRVMRVSEFVQVMNSVR